MPLFRKKGEYPQDTPELPRCPDCGRTLVLGTIVMDAATTTYHACFCCKRLYVSYLQVGIDIIRPEDHGRKTPDWDTTREVYELVQLIASGTINLLKAAYKKDVSNDCCHLLTSLFVTLTLYHEEASERLARLAKARKKQ